ncbi:MAG: HlyD family efflux transporter periplasmic adaptor subunit [Planctomycetes bacterium]|nr:HlyD family efflux transporter periplasmic adaptor subunit [Planctomycetota bacterium]
MNAGLKELGVEGDAVEAVLGRTPRLARCSVYLLIGVFALALIWAFFSKTDIHISAQGTVRPIDDLVRVQPVVGGRLLEVFVKEGDQVEEGALLFRIDGKERATALEKNRNILDSDKDRLLSLQDSWKNLSVQHSFEAEGDEIEIQKDALKIHEADLLKKNAAAVWKETKIKLKAAEAEWKRKEMSMDEEIFTAVEHERALTDFEIEQVNELKARTAFEVAEGEISLLKKEMEYKQNRSKIESERRARERDDLQRTIVLLEREIEERELEKIQLEADLRDLDVKAPVTGIVTRVTSRVAGEVVQPGDTIAMLAPEGDWIVEALVSNHDAGPLRGMIGNRVKLKFDAFPYREYGTVEGRLSKVAPDSEYKELMGWVYRIVVEMNSLTPRRGGLNDRVQLGMTATVEIVKEEQRLLTLLFKGIRNNVSSR